MGAERRGLVPRVGPRPRPGDDGERRRGHRDGLTRQRVDTLFEARVVAYENHRVEVRRQVAYHGQKPSVRCCVDTLVNAGRRCGAELCGDELPGLLRPGGWRQDRLVDVIDVRGQPAPGLWSLASSAVGQRPSDIGLHAGPVRLGMPEQDQRPFRHGSASPEMGRCSAGSCQKSGAAPEGSVRRRAGRGGGPSLTAPKPEPATAGARRPRCRRSRPRPPRRRRTPPRCCARRAGPPWSKE
jgi:hypothetical protein